MYNSRKYNSDMISSGGDTDSESDSNFNDCEEEIDINDLENIRIQTNIPISLDEDKFETISEFFFISRSKEGYILVEIQILIIV